VSDKYLIINADDGGLSPAIDEGILDTIRAGSITSVSLLVNPPFSPCIKAFKESGVSIGLHLNLTLGKPCTPSPPPLLVDQEGRFHGYGSSNHSALERATVKVEFLQQLDRFRDLTGTEPTHLDVHKHLHRSSAVVLSVVLEMAVMLNIPLRCTDDAGRSACRAAEIMATDHFLGDVKPSPYWTIERLKEQLERVSPGITELMCHPGRNGMPMEGITYMAERDEERRTFCSSEARELLASLRLVNFRTAPFIRKNR